MTEDSSIAGYDAVTAADIADFLHHLAELRFGPARHDPAVRAAFLHQKAELFTRIADQHVDSDPGYAEQVRQMALDARNAADHAIAVPQQTGPNQRRTRTDLTRPGGARSPENSGASSG